MTANRFTIQNERDIYTITSYTLQTARDMGFNKLDCNLIASAVSEISTNIIKYAQTGTFSLYKRKNNRVLNLEFIDTGPGIENLEQAQQDGFSTDNNSLGLGLGAAKRAMDEFKIYSDSDKGTRVVMCKALPISGEEIEYGVVSLPDQDYNINGDDFIIKEFDGDQILFGVLDGTGQGQLANEASKIVKKTILDNFSSPLDIIINKCHNKLRALKTERGVALGLLLIKTDTMYYAGIGDTFIHIYSTDNIRLWSQQGITGTFDLPVVHVIKKTYSDHKMVIIMCTDGIKDHFTAESLPLDEPAQTIADHIMNYHRRQYGDATVIVSKINKYR